MDRLAPQKVPETLRHLIPIAEYWGILDDVERERKVREAMSQEIEELKKVIAEHDDALDEWLAGPEANATTYSNEYLAFSAMRMAADYA